MRISDWISYVCSSDLDELFEIACLPEIAVDRGETHVGHLVERRQGVHHQLADQLGGNLRLARRFQTADDAVHHPRDALRVDLTLLQRQRQDRKSTRLNSSH